MFDDKKLRAVVVNINFIFLSQDKLEFKFDFFSMTDRPCLSISFFTIQSLWKAGSDAKIEPPIHGANLFS